MHAPDEHPAEDAWPLLEQAIHDTRAGASSGTWPDAEQRRKDLAEFDEYVAERYKQLRRRPA